jgi:uncharacterized protein YbgA (DUF1722 family)/uncharacterized protein YbbK (DUF523 family)
MPICSRPRVVISKCIEFDACRWNGLTIHSPFVQKLTSLVDVIPVCPEVEIGLGVPRKPIRLVQQKDLLRLLQSETGSDLTEKMKLFAESFLSSLQEIDGFILKDRSPSCGYKDVKIYPAPGKVSPVAGNGSGFFGTAVMARFPLLAIENEGRLRNFSLREHFLTRLFLLASFREFKTQASLAGLIEFQAQNKLLLMAYNQSILRKLGRVVAATRTHTLAEKLPEYESLLRRAIARAPRYTSNINVLMHGLGYFSKKLSAGEKSFFLQTLEKYRQKKVPLGTCIALLNSWIIRYHEAYLARQTFFSPYPEALIEITDSGKGRDA